MQRASFPYGVPFHSIRAKLDTGLDHSVPLTAYILFPYSRSLANWSLRDDGALSDDFEIRYFKHGSRQLSQRWLFFQERFNRLHHGIYDDRVAFRIWMKAVSDCQFGVIFNTVQKGRN